MPHEINSPEGRGPNRHLPGNGERFLMIADAGGYDFFYDGQNTDYSMYSG